MTSLATPLSFPDTQWGLNTGNDDSAVRLVTSLHPSPSVFFIFTNGRLYPYSVVIIVFHSFRTGTTAIDPTIARPTLRQLTFANEILESICCTVSWLDKQFTFVIIDTYSSFPSILCCLLEFDCSCYQFISCRVFLPHCLQYIN